MTRCQKCRKKSSVILTCKACNLECCSRCIDMSIHECQKTIDFINEKRKSLEDVLLNNKTKETKILTL